MNNLVVKQGIVCQCLFELVKFVFLRMPNDFYNPYLSNEACFSVYFFIASLLACIEVNLMTFFNGVQWRSACFRYELPLYCL